MTCRRESSAVVELSTIPGVTVIGVSTIPADRMDLATETVDEWGITGFPNIADDGEVHLRFGIVGHPAAVAISAGGSLVTDVSELDVQDALNLIDRARSRDT